MLFNIFNLFKKEDIFFPPTFAIIKINDIAREQGITDAENKIILLYENGELIKRMPYTKAHANALQELEHIPVIEEEEQEEDFEWDSVATMGVINYKK